MSIPMRSPIVSQSDMQEPEVIETQIPKTVWVIGVMMLLINLSFVMVFSVSGVYLKAILGVATGWIGLLEGLAEAFSFFTKLFSGVVSDYFRKRRPIMIAGYSLMVFSRIFLAACTGFFGVLSSRLLERVGNGIQATPRDALVSDVAPAKSKGTCFGLKRSLATAGSCLGGAVGLVVMQLSDGNFTLLFWLATLPAVVAMVLLLTSVREPKHTVTNVQKAERHLLKWSDLKRMGKPYWLLMVVVAIFMTARVGETMLVLHANQNFGLDPANVPVIMILYNLTYCLSSYPIGYLADRISRFNLLGLSIAVLVAADLVLATANSLTAVMIGVVIWGAQMGMAQSVFMAMIASMAPKELRGTAFGFFYLISAVASVAAGLGGGLVAQYHGEAMTFMASGIVAGAGLLFLRAFMTDAMCAVNAKH